MPIRNANELRIAFIASKKVGNAVKRNKAVRLLKEASRLLLKDYKLEGAHLVVVANNKILNASFNDVVEDIKSSFEQVRSKLKP